MRTTLSLAAAALLLAACTTQEPPVRQGEDSSNASARSSRGAVSPSPTTDAYENKADGYTLNKPKGWTVKENATLPSLNRPSKGTSFTPPSSFGEGTSFLSGVVFVEKTSGACPASSAKPVTMGQGTFTKFNSAVAGADGTLETETFVMESGNNCYSLILETKVCLPGRNCKDASVTKFDKATIIRLFRPMVSSFQVS